MTVCDWKGCVSRDTEWVEVTLSNDHGEPVTARPRLYMFCPTHRDALLASVRALGNHDDGQPSSPKQPDAA